MSLDRALVAPDDLDLAAIQLDLYLKTEYSRSIKAAHAAQTATARRAAGNAVVAR